MLYNRKASAFQFDTPKILQHGGGFLARINIEDSLFRDNRFIDLAIKLGSRTMALGALIEAFILAQEHYLTTVNDRLIPLNDWKRQKISDAIIEVGFAEIREKGIYVIGSKDQFAWLIQRSDAGRKSAEAKKERKQSTTVNDRATEPDGSQPLTPTLPQQTNKQTTTFGKFEAIEELKDDGLNEVLTFISPVAQKRWLRTYKDADWLKSVLNEAVSYYVARGDDLSGKWGETLHHALNRARAAQKNPKKAPSAKQQDTNNPDYWEDVFSKVPGDA